MEEKRAMNHLTLMVEFVELTCLQIPSQDKFPFRSIEIMKDQEIEKQVLMSQSAMATEELLLECHHWRLQEIQGIESYVLIIVRYS